MKYCPICAKTYDDNAAVCEVDGAKLRRSGLRQDTLIDKVIKGRYRVLKKLGEGGMGTVYLADQFAINRKVALKIVHPDYARDEDFVKRFRQEAMLAASFSHHNVVTVFDFDQADDDSLYIVMEYVDGLTLSEIIQENPMDVGLALHLGIQIAEGLSAAHRVGVIHRDIKPENIMVVDGGKKIKLMDFGIARLRDSAAATRLTQTGMIMGTPAYMAPEQIEGGELSERTDIYAFGIVIYEMLTGRVPFKAPTPGAVLIKHLHETPIPLSTLRKEIPLSVERIVVQALQKSPEKRLGSMDEVVEALKKAQRETEQPSSSGISPIAPRIAGVRRAFAAAATPFRRLLGMASSASAASTKNYQTDAENLESSGQHERPPETSFRLATPGESGDIATPIHRQPQDAPRVDPSEIADRLEKAEAKVSDRPPEWEDQGLPVADMPKMTASATAETIAETAAFTQPLQAQEQFIQEREALGVYRKVGAEISMGEDTPATPREANRTSLIGLTESSHIDDSGIRSEQPATQVIDLLRPPERQATFTGEMRATNASVPSATIAETGTFTQPVEKLPTQKRGWLVATVASLFVVLIGVLGGVTVFRHVDAPPPVPAVKTQPPEVEQTTPPLTESQNSISPRSEDMELAKQVPSVAAVPEVKMTDRLPSKGLRAKDEEKPAAKSLAKSPTPPATAIVKRPDSQTIKESDSKEPGKVTKPDPEQSPYPSAAAEVETKKPDLLSKKIPEPSAEPRTALLKPPEAPPPPTISRVELRDLSIISSKRELKVKERVLLTVRGRYSDGKEMDIIAGVQWRSSDSSIAAVNAKGEIEALKEGKAQITATYGGVASSAYALSVKGSEENRKVEEPAEQIKDLRRRLLR